MNLNHFDKYGKAHMVDISEKQSTARKAIAGGFIKLNDEAYLAVKNGTAKKGDVLGTARIAGIMAAKNTAGMIPMCHTILLTGCSVDFILHDESNEVEAVATVSTNGMTGAEMEALCAVNIALLTIYDMVKAVDRAMVIEKVCLYHKEGGKSGVYDRKDI